MKRIFKLSIAAIGLTLLVGTCKKDEDKVFATLTSHVDLTTSSLAADQASTALVFSTDGGTTYQNFANIKAGQKFKVQILDRNLGHNLKADDFYAFDWSASDPRPSDATSDSPEFTMSSGGNKLLVTVVDMHCPFDPASWVGAWGGDEVGACCGGTDANTITQDPSNPNKFIMDNFWGDHVDAYIIFSPSTSANDQIVTLPEQTTDDPGIASGTGTYDQCRGTFTIKTKYVAFGGTYEWQYNFHR